MTFDRATQRRARAGVCILAAAFLAGCSTQQASVREALGIDKTPPDEFLVVTKQPLIVPPDLQLLPPDPGAPAANGADPSALAAEATFGTKRSTASASSAEAALLSKAGADQADPRIRRRLRAENLNAKDDETVASRVLQIQRDEEETLDADEEARRLRSRQTGRRITTEDILRPSPN